MNPQNGKEINSRNEVQNCCLAKSNGSICKLSASFTENLKLIGFLHKEQFMQFIVNCYFQQDEAPAHYARRVRDYLYHMFPDRWIGCRDPLE